MGEDKDKDLEGTLIKLAKAPFRFLRSYGIPIGVGLGVGTVCWAYITVTGKGEPDFEKLLDWNTWKREIVRWPAYFLAVTAAFGGILAINNQIRKRKGKKPVKILKHFKQVFLPFTLREDEGGFKEVIDQLPDSSLAHRAFGDFYFRHGRIIEAMETYYKAISLRDDEIFPKIPVVGTNGYINVVSENIRRLDGRLRREPCNSQVLLELAMNHFSINDFDKAAQYLESADKEQEPIALHILASRFYSEISKKTDRPRLRRLSFGDSRIGRWIDKRIYFWDRQKLDQEEQKEKAEQEALAAVEQIFEIDDLEQHLESIGDYSVYRIALNGFVKGFVIAKENDYGALVSEKKNEEIFEQTVAGGKFRSVHPVRIVRYKGKDYLVLLYEEGMPLASSTKPAHFRDAMRFAARSDALMPLEHVSSIEYSPGEHFAWRLSELPEGVKSAIAENSDFLFKYSEAFPLVFDGDWRPDGNCLVNDEGHIIALDKEDKGVTIGPVTAARLLNQGTGFSDSYGLKDSMIAEDYLPVYQDSSDRDRRIQEPGLFFPVAWTSTIEKAITAYCFTKDRPSQQKSARIFLRNALHAGIRIRHDRGIRRFYSDEDRKQCEVLEKAIHEQLLAPTTS